mmetsp:Transcript_1469/g.3305  ORF Transcript_1469/g.3305 Transcript_1469/m.3305 type:complete len:205 (+) Transcript_1469:503-1117(+)
MLREARDTQVGVSFDGSLGREQITGHEFDQCCFSCSIGTNKSHTRVKINTKIDVAVEFDPTRVRKTQSLDGQHRHRQLSCIRERPIPVGILLGEFRQSRLELLLEKLFSGLGLSDHLYRTVTETSDEILDFGNVTLLGLVLSHLHHVLIAARLDIHIVVSAKVTKFFVGHVETNNVRTNLVHEILRVTNKKQDFVPFTQVFFQP